MKGFIYEAYSLLNEHIQNNIFWYASSVKFEGNPRPTPEGIHLSQDRAGARSVANKRHFLSKDSFLYLISLKTQLHPYECNKDLIRWDAKNLAIFLLKSDFSLLEEEIEILEKFSKLKNGKSTFEDLQKIKTIFNRLGYDSITYTNDYEDSLKLSVMLFDDSMIESCKFKGNQKYE